MNRARKHTANPSHVVAAALGLLALVAAPVHAACEGDCSETGEVTVDEIVRMVNIALGQPPAAACDAGDADGDGQTTTDDLPHALANALYGCPASPDRTPSPTGTTYGPPTATPPPPSPSTTPVWTVAPPDLTDVAPPVSSGSSTDMYTATRFLYEGPNPLQTGVAPGTIDPVRAAVVRGTVYDRAMTPLPGVTITVLNHPEYGQTLTRENGNFDLAVNGGGVLTVWYDKAGYLGAQRQVTVGWKNYASVDDVVLITPDPQVTTIDLTNTDTPFQVARGSVQSDADGTRQATLLFPQGTQAEAVMPDGSSWPITTLSVRATEFTVGPTGPLAMPALLPPTSGYTYAVVFTADEAKAAGATDVVFAEPIPLYVENFLNFTTGVTVPLGQYRDDLGQWVAADSGIVLQILSITAGAADLDTDGDGVIDNGVALGISDAERRQLASLYGAGQSLWRVLIPHFDRPWDANWPTRCLKKADCTGPINQQVAPEDSQPDGNCQVGSIIECQNQTLGERIGIAGTPFSLNYRSSRGPGHRVSYQLKIPLIGATLPNGLAGIKLDVEVAGRSFSESFPATTDQSVMFEWDGRDAYGRLLQGAQPTLVHVGYVYPMEYADTSQFAKPPTDASSVTADRARMEMTFWRSWQTVLGTWDARAQGLGGWTLNVHHAYDSVERMLYLGDGTRSGHLPYGVITTVAGTGADGLSGDGGPATAAALSHPWGVAAAADGSIYMSDRNNDRIRRLGRDGIITTVAGGGIGGCLAGTGGPATGAVVSRPTDVAVGPDGSLYVADFGCNRIARVGLDGLLTTVAGNPNAASLGDEGPALAAQVQSPTGVAVALDGTIYIAQPEQHRVRRVGTDGIITTLAGTGAGGNRGDGGLAVLALLSSPVGVAAGPDGSVYIADLDGCTVRRVGTDGIISRVAGTGTCGGIHPSFVERMTTQSLADGVPATLFPLFRPRAVAVAPDSTLYIADKDRILKVGTDGLLTVLAGLVDGDGNGGYGGDGGPPALARLSGVGGLVLGMDGGLYIADRNNNRIRRISAPAPAGTGELLVPAPDGSEVYVFTETGLHLRTFDALTGALLYQFSHDADGRLATVQDGDGNTTTIERDANGNATAIVGPYGQRTTLEVDADGYLAGLTNPANETIQLGTAAGLLTSLTDAKGAVHRFSYDPDGRLTKDEDPAGGFKTLAREQGTSGYTVTITTALGQTSRYVVQMPSGGGFHRLDVHPDGTTTDLIIGTDASRTITYADGTVVALQQGPDPRWGMQAPIPTSLTYTLPSGLTGKITAQRTLTLTNPADLLNLKSQTDVVAVNGRTYTTAYDGVTRTLNATTPTGRHVSVVLDAHGRIVQAQADGLLPLSHTYDSHGRPSAAAWGTGPDARTASLTYDSNGYLNAITDPLGRTVSLSYDAAGRLASQTMPDGRVVQLASDANGNPIGVTPPDRPLHTFAYTPVDLLSVYTPPDVGAGSNKTVYTYNADRQLTGVSLPDGRTVALDYTVAGANRGRVGSLAFSRGSLAYDYDSAAGQLETLTAPGGVLLGFDYDGMLIKTTTASGPVVGSIGRTYNSSLRVSSLSVNGADPVEVHYDDDDLLTGAGSLTLTRDSQTGLVTGSTLGQITTTTAYNGLGEATVFAAAHAGTELLHTQYVRDKLGRITHKTDTVAGATHTYDYTYDLAGRLVEVRQDGGTVENYTYDGNGNRLSGPQGATTYTYDAQDRLLSMSTGPTTFAYGANGELASATTNGQTTHYAYDELGNLVSVALSDGKQIEFVIDGRNRRIGKKVNGILVQGFLYQDGLKPIAELDGSGTVVSRFVYATRVNVPDLMIRDGQTYRIITDRLGSPRLVIDVADGAVAQRTDYDSFGNVVRDTAPGFQPFGFAGGLYDADTRLVRFGARDYAAATGRWTAKDGALFAGGDTNLFVYAANNPLRYVDVTGLRPLSASEWFDALGDAVNLGVWWLIGSPTGGSDFGPGDSATEYMKASAAYEEALEAYRNGQAEYVPSKGYYYLKGRSGNTGACGNWKEPLLNPLWGFTGTFTIHFTPAGPPGDVDVEIINNTNLESFLHGVLLGDWPWVYTNEPGRPIVSNSQQRYRFRDWVGGGL